MSLKIENLKIKYKNSSDPVINGLDLTVTPGQIIGIAGKNGSGKTSLLRSIVKQFFPNTLDLVEGQINLGSTSIRVLQRVKSQILTFSVKEELGLKLAFNQVDRYTRVDKISAYTDRFGLNELMESDPRNLSSGQLQLLIILSSLIDVGSNSIILLDEPFSLLDQENTELLNGFLSELVTDGHTIIITFPYVPRVSHFAEIYELINGRLTDVSIGRNFNKFEIDPIDPTPFYSLKGVIGYNLPLMEINIKLPKSGLILVTGKNGSGKTAILMTIAGVLPLISGFTNCEGFYLPQDSMNVFWKSRVKDEFKQLPNWMNDFAEKSPFMLSEGERKKLSIQIAFDTNQHLALDEPTQSLDIDGINWFIEQIQEYVKHKLVIIATNDLNFIDLVKPFSINVFTEDFNK